MRLTVEFDSLKEFQQHFKLESASNEQLAVAIAQLGNKVDGLYKSGESIVVDEIRADIKDTDEVSDDYSEALYQRALSEYAKLVGRHPRREQAFKEAIFNLVGDYEIRAGLSDDAYQKILAHFSIIRDL